MLFWKTFHCCNFKNFLLAMQKHFSICLEKLFLSFVVVSFFFFLLWYNGFNFSERINMNFYILVKCIFFLCLMQTKPFSLHFCVWYFLLFLLHPKLFCLIDLRWLWYQICVVLWLFRLSFKIMS